MSRYTGPQFKGAAKKERALKKVEALARNAKSNAYREVCGHIHGVGVSCQGRVVAA